MSQESVDKVLALLDDSNDDDDDNDLFGTPILARASTTNARPTTTAASVSLAKENEAQSEQDAADATPTTIAKIKRREWSEQELQEGGALVLLSFCIGSVLQTHQ